MDAARSDWVQGIASGDATIDIALEMDYSMMDEPTAGNHFTGLVVQMSGGGAISLSQISDESVSKMSRTAMDNYFGHYPAGCSHR